MFKIQLRADDLSNHRVLLAMTDLLSLLSNELNSEESRAEGREKTLILHSRTGGAVAEEKKESLAARKTRSPKLNLTLRGSDVDRWIELLEPRQQEFVLKLRDAGSLSLEEVAQIMGVKRSAQDQKKKINGLIGSIVRWSKVKYVREVAELPQHIPLRSVKLSPPWYCVEGVYYWKE